MAPRQTAIDEAAPSSAKVAGFCHGRPNRMVVDLDAVTENCRLVRALVGPAVHVIASVKAQAYGHGAVEVAWAAVRGGAIGAAVGEVDTGLALRRAGLRGTILVYPGVAISSQTLAVTRSAGLTLTVQDFDAARNLAAAGAEGVEAFIKVDVGHMRLGVPPKDIAGLAEVVVRAGVKVTGVMTHMFDAGLNVQWMQCQLDRFSTALDALEATGPLPAHRVAASTAILMRHDALRFDPRLNTVDPGRFLVGAVAPNDSVLGCRAAFTRLTSELIQIKTFDDAPATGLEPFAYRPGMTVGIAPIGRSDGYADINPGQVIVRGRLAPVLAVWTEHLAVDLSGISAATGDEIVLYGAQGSLRIGMADIRAARPGLRPVDLAMSIRPSVRRDYQGR